MEKLKEKYQNVEQEYIYTDLCLLTITLEYTYYSIKIDFDGINNDDQNINIPSISVHDHINLHDQSVVHQIIYICSFDLCNEILFLSRAFKEFLPSRGDADEYTDLVKYLRITLYDEADLTVNCYDSKLNLTRCEDGACYATGSINGNSSFTGCCHRSKDSNEKYYVNVEKKIYPTSREHFVNDYQLTYTCNKNTRRICNSLTSFEDVYERIPITFYALSDLVNIANHSIFNNSNMKKTSTNSQYLTKTTVFGRTSTTNTDFTTISNQANPNEYLSKRSITFPIVLFLCF